MAAKRSKNSWMNRHEVCPVHDREEKIYRSSGELEKLDKQSILDSKQMSLFIL